MVPDPVLDVIRKCQEAVPCHLTGGAALSGVHLAHRLSRDIDLACRSRADVRALVGALPDLVRGSRLVQDGGLFVRADLGTGLSLDITFEGTADLDPPVLVEGVRVESFSDLRASKLTCIVSRSEPRDLVDLLFLERGGHSPEADLALALRKDAGIDPGVIAWVLGEFPVSPLPAMLVPLTERELQSYRDALCARMKRLAVPGSR